MVKLDVLNVLISRNLQQTMDGPWSFWTWRNWSDPLLSHGKTVCSWVSGSKDFQIFAKQIDWLAVPKTNMTAENPYVNRKCIFNWLFFIVMLVFGCVTDHIWRIASSWDCRWFNCRILRSSHVYPRLDVYTSISSKQATLYHCNQTCRANYVHHHTSICYQLQHPVARSVLLSHSFTHLSEWKLKVQPSDNPEDIITWSSTQKRRNHL